MNQIHEGCLEAIDGRVDFLCLSVFFLLVFFFLVFARLLDVFLPSSLVMRLGGLGLFGLGSVGMSLVGVIPFSLLVEGSSVFVDVGLRRMVVQDCPVVEHLAISCVVAASVMQLAHLELVVDGGVDRVDFDIVVDRERLLEAIRIKSSLLGSFSRALNS